MHIMEDSYRAGRRKLWNQTNQRETTSLEDNRCPWGPSICWEAVEHQHYPRFQAAKREVLAQHALLIDQLSTYLVVEGGHRARPQLHPSEALWTWASCLNSLNFNFLILKWSQWLLCKRILKESNEVFKGKCLSDK